MRVAHRGGSHHHPVRAALEQRINRFNAAHPARNLQLDAGQLEDARDDGHVARGTACSIQVDYMNAVRTGGRVALRDLHRIVRINDRVVVVALGQTHAAAAEDVDRGNDQQRFEAKSG